MDRTLSSGCRSGHARSNRTLTAPSNWNHGRAVHLCKTEIRDEEWCGRRSRPSVAEEGDGPLHAPGPLPCTTAPIPATQTHVPPRDKSSHSCPGAKGGFSPHLAGPLSGLSKAAHSALPGTLPLVSVSHTPLPFQSTHTMASWLPGPPPSLWTALLGSWTRPRHRLICPCDMIAPSFS